MSNRAYEPKILGVLCTWCAYSGADGAGQARTAYPANIKVVRVMCTGRVDPALIIDALTSGMDGVLVAGCHPGDCHYINGNCKAMGRMPLLRTMLGEFGVEQERVRLEWVSASEGAKYAEIVREMVEQLRALGPLEWNGPVPAAERLSDFTALPDDHVSSPVEESA